MSIRRAILAILLPLTSLVSPALAQTGRATLTGSVTDAQGAALQGAKIVLAPGGIAATSDATGQFTILGVPAGNYTVNVSYSGFSDLSRSAALTAGQSSRFDASLSIAANQQNVQVYAGRQGGEIEAINRTFNADNIINVLPADVITSLPNANVADAVGRLPGVTLERDEGEGKYVKIRGTEPRLTNVTLDGVNIATPETVRQMKLDIIPADLVESVQINKTLQANMEGSGIGGSVDLRTKSAEDLPTIYLESTGGYVPIVGGRPKYQFDGTIGKRFFGGKKLGVLFSGSYDFSGEASTTSSRDPPSPVPTTSAITATSAIAAASEAPWTIASATPPTSISSTSTPTSITSVTIGSTAPPLTPSSRPHRAAPMAPSPFRLCGAVPSRMSAVFNSAVVMSCANRCLPGTLTPPSGALATMAIPPPSSPRRPPPIRSTTSPTPLMSPTRSFLTSTRRTALTSSTLPSTSTPASGSRTPTLRRSISALAHLSPSPTRFAGMPVPSSSVAASATYASSPIRTRSITSPVRLLAIPKTQPLP